MSYELRKPITEDERLDFIVTYNHNQGLKIEDTEMYLFALEKNEIMGEKEIEIDVPDFEIVDVEVEIHDVDEEGNYIYDEDGNPVTHTETRPVQEPVMIEYEDTETVIDYDEEGNPVGSHEITVIKHKQQTHKETIIIPYPVINPNYEQEEAEKERQRVAMLHLTRGDVFRGLLQAKGVTRTQLRAIIENLPEENQEQSIIKEMAFIDFDEALDFYRGNALIDTVGAQLGITSEQMTRFFDTNDWHELIKNVE